MFVHPVCHLVPVPALLHWGCLLLPCNCLGQAHREARGVVEEMEEGEQSKLFRAQLGAGFTWLTANRTGKPSSQLGLRVQWYKLNIIYGFSLFSNLLFQPPTIPAYSTRYGHHSDLQCCHREELKAPSTLCSHLSSGFRAEPHSTQSLKIDVG